MRFACWKTAEKEGSMWGQVSNLCRLEDSPRPKFIHWALLPVRVEHPRKPTEQQLCTTRPMFRRNIQDGGVGGN